MTQILRGTSAAASTHHLSLGDCSGLEASFSLKISCGLYSPSFARGLLWTWRRFFVESPLRPLLTILRSSTALDLAQFVRRASAAATTHHHWLEDCSGLDADFSLKVRFPPIDHEHCCVLGGDTSWRSRRPISDPELNIHEIYKFFLSRGPGKLVRTKDRRPVLGV